jgi:hypothetical protein
MTDLNFSVEGRNPKDIAYYFSTTTEMVEAALMEGAKTYQEVYDYIQEYEDE